MDVIIRRNRFWTEKKGKRKKGNSKHSNKNVVCAHWFMFLLLLLFSLASQQSQEGTRHFTIK
jgi:hypothetical protein